MAVSPLPVFTPTGYTQVSAQPFAQAVLLPLAGGETSVLLSNYGGSAAAVALSAAIATTTATQATVGSSTIVVASATSIVVGQLVLGVGIAPGTLVSKIAGTTITISQPTTAALSTTAVVFVAGVTQATGVAVLRNKSLALGIGANTYLAYVVADGTGPANLNIAVGS